MDIDKSPAAFRLTADETKLLNLPAESNIWPFSRADELLAAVEAARERTAGRYPELANYPFGSARVAALTGLRVQEANLALMVEAIQPHLGSVATGAEAFLAAES